METRIQPLITFLLGVFCLVSLLLELIFNLKRLERQAPAMNNYADINPDALASNCATQNELDSKGGEIRFLSSTHHASTAQQQQNAASTLKSFSNEDVLAWLKLARSARLIEPITEPYPGEVYLSPPQVLALSCLRDCPDDRILGLLELVRFQCW